MASRVYQHCAPCAAKYHMSQQPVATQSAKVAKSVAAPHPAAVHPAAIHPAAIHPAAVHPAKSIPVSKSVGVPQPIAPVTHLINDAVVINPSVQDQDSLVIMPLDNLNHPDVLAPSVLTPSEIGIVGFHDVSSARLVRASYCKDGPIVVQVPHGGNRRLAADIYSEDAYANPWHVDVPASYEFNDFEKTWNLWNPFTGRYVPHDGLREIYDSKELERLVEKQQREDIKGNLRKHDQVIDLEPGIVPDYRWGPKKDNMDFGGLEPVEIVDGESKLRLYNSYATTPGYGMYESMYQNHFF